MKNRRMITALVLIMVIFSSISIYSAIRDEKAHKERIEQAKQEIERETAELKEEAAIKKEEAKAREKARHEAWKEAKEKAEREAKERAEREAKERAEREAREAKERAEREAREKARKEAIARAKAEAALQDASPYGKGLASYINKVNPHIPPELALAMARYFILYGGQYGIDPNITVAMAQGESTFYPDAVNSKGGYRGIMQTNGSLAEAAGYSPDDLFDPEISIKVGTKHLYDMINMFGDLKLGITACAYGSGAVKAGHCSLAYAEKILERAGAIDDYLVKNGYL